MQNRRKERCPVLPLHNVKPKRCQKEMHSFKYVVQFFSNTLILYPTLHNKPTGNCTQIIAFSTPPPIEEHHQTARFRNSHFGHPTSIIWCERNKFKIFTQSLEHPSNSSARYENATTSTVFGMCRRQQLVHEV